MSIFLQKHHIITYGNSLYENHGVEWLRHAKNSLFDTHKLYTDQNINQVEAFSRELNRNQDFQEVYNAPMGGGYWIWKPFIINDYLHKIDFGDLLIYADLRWVPNSDSRQDDFQKVYQTTSGCKYQIFIPRYTKDNTFPQGSNGKRVTTLNRHYNNSLIYKYFNLKNENQFKDKFQIWATVQCVIKNQESLKIYKKWQEVACDNPKLFSNIKRTNEDENFICHRHDQSVWNFICELYECETFDANEYFHYCNIIQPSKLSKPKYKI